MNQTNEKSMSTLTKCEARIVIFMLFLFFVTLMGIGIWLIRSALFANNMTIGTANVTNVTLCEKKINYDGSEVIEKYYCDTSIIYEPAPNLYATINYILTYTKIPESSYQINVYFPVANPTKGSIDDLVDYGKYNGGIACICGGIIMGVFFVVFLMIQIREPSEGCIIN
jgi:hypothetical protein